VKEFGTEIRKVPLTGKLYERCPLFSPISLRLNRLISMRPTNRRSNRIFCERTRWQGAVSCAEINRQKFESFQGGKQPGRDSLPGLLFFINLLIKCFAGESAARYVNLVFQVSTGSGNAGILFNRLNFRDAELAKLDRSQPE
jgi:hypothetical protein